MKIGFKLVCGVALASNICILMLLYSIWHWDKQVNIKAGELVQIQKDLNKDLRGSVSNLQNRLLKLPEQLETDPGKRVIQWLKTNKEVVKENLLTGRDSYKQRYNRSQRRDLMNNEFIIQESEKALIISKGVMGQGGEFTETIQQFFIKSDSPSSDLFSVQFNIDKIIALGRTGQSMRQTLKTIKGDLAEELITAEQSRTQMLTKLELIDSTEQLLGKAKKQRKAIVISIGILTIVANIFILYFLTRTIITKPIKKIVLSLKDIAQGQGDLTHSLTVKSKDELGELAYWFNSFVLKLKSIISQVQEQTEKLDKSTHTLSAISTDLGEAASHMHEKSNSATDSIESTVVEIEKIAQSAQKTNMNIADVTDLSRSLTSDMDQLGSSTKDVSGAVSSAASSIEEMYASFKEVTKSTCRGADVTLSATHQAKSSTTQGKNLKKAAKEINEVVDLIKAIADQTHLLAFNAAIQAAGAGSAGKGFSVVANEVKELAGNTASATKTIQDKIRAMQAGTDGIIKSVLTIDDIIKEIHEIMSTIAAAIEQQTISVNEISKHMAETSTFTDTVSNTLQKAISHEKILFKKLGLVSVEVSGIAQDAGKAFSQTEQTRKNVNVMDKAAIATLEDTKRIENQIQTLNSMQKKLHQIVIQFKT